MKENLKFDKHNYRIHGEKNKEVIKSSLEDNGCGRSILVDNENNIIAGNGVYEQWEGRPIKIIETDGSELIVVKRKDINPDDPRAKKLAITDNSTSDLSTFDYDLLKEDLKDLDFEEIDYLGIDYDKIASEINKEIKEKEDPFTEEFNSFDDKNCEMPIVPEFFEKHECFIVVCHNEIDERFIRELFNLNRTFQSFSGDKKERKSNVIDIEEVRKCVN
jgi:hypothetical protein